MPRQSLQGRTCSVSGDGGRARTLQPSNRSSVMRRRRMRQRSAPGLDYPVAGPAYPAPGSL
ncbi:hypothetical protein DB818_15270 [Xanthomonas perforans]|uniref:Uncharacterized protein n=1 Tax=Xanthomonas perforans TaxID=442694 RepID=A0AAQ0YMT8_XANPE|nr:hypothetical protein DB854_21540 [Xanthomonas perforans]RXD41814.1 hypothetical protein DB757_09205 [Xanthomonas perforans]RXD47161.1 hypothetical protein DB761_04340 [Xanthomonas perforans]RXD53012.1 hypothetical protein DB769_13485 [Xanthomonas perforans]RXD56028.1 hypothetical protein DB755_16065 [Xanthomonas perforans]